MKRNILWLSLIIAYNIAVFRTKQAILGCLILFIIFSIAKWISNDFETSLWCVGVMAVSPWFITLGKIGFTAIIRLGDITNPRYGIYYLFSSCLVIIGLVRDLIEHNNKKSLLMWGWAVIGVVVAAMAKIPYVAINIVIIPLFYFISRGITFVTYAFRRTYAIDNVVIGLLYMISTTIFFVIK